MLTLIVGGMVTSPTAQRKAEAQESQVPVCATKEIKMTIQTHVCLLEKTDPFKGSL